MSKVTKRAKICEFCGKEFVPSSNFQKYCKGPHIRQCPICGKDYVEDNVENLKRPPVACSYECRKVRREQTSLKKYGIKAPGNNPKAREKSKATMREKFGVDYAMQSKEVLAKSKQTLINRYGDDNINKTVQGKLIKSRNAFRRISSVAKSLDVHSYDTSSYDSLIQALQSYGISYHVEDDCEVGKVVRVDSSVVYIVLAQFDFSNVDGMLLLETVSKKYESSNLQVCYVFPWTDVYSVARLGCTKLNLRDSVCKIYKLNKDFAINFFKKYCIDYYPSEMQLQYWGILYQKEPVLVVSGYVDETVFMIDNVAHHPNYNGLELLSNLFQLIEDYNQTLYFRTRAIDRCFGKFLFGSDAESNIVNIQWPSLHFVKDGICSVFEYQRFLDTDALIQVHNMIDAGYLPVPDCGKAIYEFKL